MKHAYPVEVEINVLKHLLATNEKWAKKALVRIYEAQTADEKDSHETLHENGVGFNGHDAQILTKIAKWYNQHGTIGDGYMRILHDRMPKYARQIFSLRDFDHEMFDNQVAWFAENKAEVCNK